MDFTWIVILEEIFVLKCILVWYLVEKAKPAKFIAQLFATIFSGLTLALIVVTLIEYI